MALALALGLAVSGVTVGQVVGPWPGPTPARAESLDQARAAVTAAQDRVDRLRRRMERALAAYESTLGDLALGVSRSIQADQKADAAAAAAEADRRAAGRRVRALYMAGGATALVASVLDAGGAAEAMTRMTYVRRLVRSGSVVASAAEATSGRLADRAATLEAEADSSTVRASDVHRRYAELSAALEAATAEVTALSARARTLEEAQQLLAQVAALNAAAAAAGSAQVATARPTDVPATYRRLYAEAARTCRGMSWTLLAAVGQVESGHGANPGTSYAGAQGPMQFMPATFAAYGVDGDGDGDVDIQDPADAVFSAANYLCANGAGRGGEALARAVWHYNRADWYVALVLKLAAQYAAAEPVDTAGAPGQEGS